MGDSRAPLFSRRTAWKRHAPAPASDVAPIDLSEGNPTRCALFDAAPILATLGHPRGCKYAPEAFGVATARDAVARYYAERAIEVDADRVCLSASTSEAYSWLFKLLCDRGDEVLIARPSYPLFEVLADLEDVTLRSFPLVREASFRPDLDALEGAITPRTRAIVLVHPNNPTGNFLRRDDAAAIDALAARHGLALIVDEVFGDYAHRGDPTRLPSFAGARRDARALTFVLSGLSKVVAMPQLKLGWIVTSGPHVVVEEALARLEVIADTYLSVASPVQLALDEILAHRTEIQARIVDRVRTNLSVLDAALTTRAEHVGARRLALEGGWYAVVEVPRTRSDEAWIEALRDEAGVAAQPGYFFDFERRGVLVVSLLPEVETFSRGVERMARVIGG